MTREQAQEQATAVVEFFNILRRAGVSPDHTIELTKTWMDLQWGKPYYSHSFNTTDETAGLDYKTLRGLALGGDQ